MGQGRLEVVIRAMFSSLVSWLSLAMIVHKSYLTSRFVFTLTILCVCSSSEMYKLVVNTCLFLVTGTVIEAFAFFGTSVPLRAMRMGAVTYQPGYTLDSVDAVSGYESRQLEHLIPEEMVTDDASASDLADRCMAEAERLFFSKADWKSVEVMDPNIKVEVIPLDGGYAKSGVHLVRGEGIIPASAEKFYDFQIR